MNYSALLSNIIDSSVEKMSAISEAQWSFKSNASVWSKKEILGHLIDSAYNNHQRFVRAQQQDDLIFQGYAQDDWVRLHDYQSQASTDILSVWVHSNRHLANLLAKLPVAVSASATTQHNFDIIGFRKAAKGSPSTLGYLIEDYLVHLEHHVKQIVPDYEPLISA